MRETSRSLSELLRSVPDYDSARVRQECAQAVDSDRHKLIVLDDDPTGTQTVHDVYVYTDWQPETVAEAFDDGNKVSFFLTNSRGVTAEESRRMHLDIGRAVAAAAGERGVPYAIISRSDSTLRGHYPLETAVLRQTMAQYSGIEANGEIIVPFFREGGRYTADDVHYVASGDTLGPAGQTEFAGDRTFGYRSSDLREWVEEKTGGEYPAAGVLSVTLDELRRCDYGAIEQKLRALKGFSKLIVNALSDDDIRVFVTALCRVMGEGRHFLFRSAATLVKVMGGISDKPPLTRAELCNTKNRNGGIVVIGSHVNRTTQQLAALREAEGLHFIEFNQHLALDDAAFEQELSRVVNEAQQSIGQGQSTVVYTRRERFDRNTGNPEDELRLAVKISDAVTSIVARLTVRPNFVIAKGGITSSDIGTRALRCRRARVMGQILPGVPVWETGDESKFPHMPYVIFPGNVGGTDALREAVYKMDPNGEEEG